MSESIMPQSVIAEISVDLKNPAFSSFLDMARWMAALLVFVGHLRNPLFLGYSDLASDERSLPVLGWYFVTGWYWAAVIVFFVLSGYLVGGIALAKRSADRFDAAQYAVDRFARIYVAFLPALVLTLALDLLGSNLLGGAGLYDGSQSMIAQKLSNLSSFDANLTVRNFFGTLLMMQTFHVSPFGSNQPLWTISCEFWFYVVFGLMVAASKRGLAGRQRFVSGGLIIFTLILLGGAFPYLFGLWLIGVGIALVPKGRPQLRVPFILLFFLLLVAIRIYAPHLNAIPYYLEIRDYVVALAFALVLYAMRGVRAHWLSSLAAVNRWMADFSFSLYLIHFPLMIFVLSVLFATGFFPEIRSGYSPTDVTGLAVYAGTIVAVLASSWLFAYLTERNTGYFRNLLSKYVRVLLP